VTLVSSRFGAFLNIYVYDASGNLVASDQHKLCDGEGFSEIKAAPAVITVEDEYAVVRGDGFEHRFNTHYGRLECIDGLTSSPVDLTVWRAPTDNDRNVKNDWYSSRFNMLRGKLYSCDIEGNRITVKSSLSAVSREKVLDCTAVYTFYADGSIAVEASFETFLNNGRYLPRLGFEFTTEEKDFAYFAYGPYESYCDMHNASKLGVYYSSAEKEYVDYVKPQEHGNHYGARYIRLGGYEIVSEKDFEFRVGEYSSKELERKAHNFELVKDGRTHVRIDCKVSGIGSNSCGPVLPEEYRLNDKALGYSFIFKKV
jgi:beta-galactosidase